MTTNSTMSDLERRVEDAIVHVLGEHRTWYGPLFVNEVARAALKAHAEWLESRMQKMCSAANDARLADPEEAEGIFRTMISAAQEEQP